MMNDPIRELAKWFDGRNFLDRVLIAARANDLKKFLLHHAFSGQL